MPDWIVIEITNEEMNYDKRVFSVHPLSPSAPSTFREMECKIAEISRPIGIEPLSVAFNLPLTRDRKMFWHNEYMDHEIDDSERTGLWNFFFWTPFPLTDHMEIVANIEKSDLIGASVLTKVIDAPAEEKYGDFAKWHSDILKSLIVEAGSLALSDDIKSSSTKKTRRL